MSSFFKAIIRTTICFVLLLSGFCHGLAALANPQVIAHRGGKKWAPENTLSAFKKSVDAGVDAIELDIHRCKSGELVVIHDETLDRTTDGKGLVKDRTYEELKSFSAGKWYASEFTGDRVPLLKDVLALVDGKCRIFIEVKNAPVEYPGIEDDLIKMLADYKHEDKICVISFDHGFLKKFHEKAPQYSVAFLDVAIVSDIGSYARSIGASGWNPGFGEIRKDAVDRAHAVGLKVNPWTVNEPDQWESATSMGVDGIITDDPAGLRDFLDKRIDDKSVK
ncbi:MAG: glycerophosphodiester phosphodiesterase [Cyanobacteria bacterium HKST-UBA02]|nr:glycerophosphodiester phosphodiesterase [Cyanobacteria bacterium HKST-UBA02]